MTKKIAFVLTALTVGAFLAGPAANQARAQGTVGAVAAGLSILKDGLQIGDKIAGYVNQSQGAANAAGQREGWVMGLGNAAFFASGQRYNIMVYNLREGGGFRNGVFPPQT